MILFFISFTNCYSQEIPKWLVQEWESKVKDSGIWIAHNSKYQNENEPYDAYGQKWEWGIGKKSLKGKLFAIKDGKELGTIWEFRLFWDPLKKKAFIQQFGGDGTYGIGELIYDKENVSRSLQTFSNPEGIVYKIGHLSDYNHPDFFKTISFSITEDGLWKENRVYIWKLKN